MEKDEKNYKQNLQKRGNIILGLILFLCILLPILYLNINYKQFSKIEGFIFRICSSLGFSIVGFIITFRMIPVFMQMNYAKKIFGVDINKVEDITNKLDPDRKEVPESLGIVPATVFLVISILFQVFLNLDERTNLYYNSALLSICFMIFLGWTDDILDLRWRYKLVLPTIASLPLLMVYTGSTNVLIPKFLQVVFGRFIDIGIFFKIYMSMLAVFCTNAINIYAGINGLEVGQSIIIGLSLILYNFIEVITHTSHISQCIFSLSLLLPFVFCSLGLFYYNKYPSKCFIGDTYCYFAGMTFACVGILGQYSITMLLFFIPQILNFLLSFPQLIGIIPCPRHRLPKYHKQNGKLHGQKINLNLLNYSLLLLGPQREQDICNYLMIFQIICSVVAFGVRFYLVPLIF